MLHWFSDVSIRFQCKCTAYAFDATNFSSHQQFYASLPQKPDIAICIFGYMTDNDIAINSWEEALRTIETNYTGAVSILNIIGRDFSQRKNGAIAGISSVAGERGRQSNYIYGSAKAGFTAYLSGLRNKLYKDGVHVATILPGFVYTKMTEHLMLPKLLTATPEDVAAYTYSAIMKKKNVVYIKWFWRWIMLIIKCIPETIFKKKTL
ncbi:MAG: SDR family oxidoreductase [Agriterribacter sp.]